MIVRVMSEQAVVLTPALRDSGTNCLAMADPSAIEPCFGEDSFIAHQEAARRAGIACRVCRLDGLGHDIDCPDDPWHAAADHTCEGEELNEDGEEEDGTEGTPSWQEQWNALYPLSPPFKVHQ